MNRNIIPLGDRALVIQLPLQHENQPVGQQSAGMAEVLRSAGRSWILDVVPAYTTVTVVYDPLQLLYEEAAAEVWTLLQGHIQPDPTLLPEPRVIEIPVYYGKMDGPDLPQCAERAGMSEKEFIKRHAEAVYRVAMIGFMPGFPYLTGLPPELSQPRRSSPRSVVPAGAVGIAGGQTGVYPLATPGGWQLIGRTPLSLFDPKRAEPILLRTGDVVRFVPIDEGSYALGESR
ncbi:5-oxoprolinase subunit PxpB [Paenibacillus sp. OV219]|uniref:5-oxoprolinase subunit PxpB n=1 Tax=Paenibacillus sp. OV219 TaxID=1884377 RepID=UPI0008BD7CFE|nr:5-oxoprolinase subunit PxpB [Paenibacillus sp. OV219]SEN78856.1 inhibitor of KinA [Paenibacillus sp. OV219]